MGSSTIISKRNAFRCDSLKDCTSQNYRTLFSFRLLVLNCSRNCSKLWKAELFIIEDSCKTSYCSDDEKSKLQSSGRSCGKRITHQESKRERKHTLRGKCESVFSGRHMDNVPQETHVVSVMTQEPLETVAMARDEKDDRLLPHPIRRQRLTARDK